MEPIEACEYCKDLNGSKEKDKLEYIGFRYIKDVERYYYKCPKCEQAFYWLDWGIVGSNHLEILKVKASEIISLLQ